MVLAITVFAPLQAGTAQTDDPLGMAPVGLPPALDRVLRDYERAWRAGDGKQLASLFAEDGMRLAPGSLPLRGREQLAGELKGPGGELQLRAHAYAVSDSVAWIVGGYRYPGTTGPGGKYVLALRKGRDGRWLIAADMDNSASRR